MKRFTLAPVLAALLMVFTTNSVFSGQSPEDIQRTRALQNIARNMAERCTAVINVSGLSKASHDGACQRAFKANMLFNDLIQRLTISENSAKRPPPTQEELDEFYAYDKAWAALNAAIDAMAAVEGVEPVQWRWDMEDAVK